MAQERFGRSDFPVSIVVWAFQVTNIIIFLFLFSQQATTLDLMLQLREKRQVMLGAPFRASAHEDRRQCIINLDALSHLCWCVSDYALCSCKSCACMVAFIKT